MFERVRRRMGSLIIALCCVCYIFAQRETQAYLQGPVIRSSLHHGSRSKPWALRDTLAKFDQSQDTVETIINRKIHGMERSAASGAGKQEKCIIVGVDKTLHLHSADELSTMESLTEMMELCKTANLHIVGSCVQRLSVPNPKSYLGEGKMAELRELCKLSGAQVVVVDDDITPRQQRCIEQALAKSAAVTEEDEEETADSTETDELHDTDYDTSLSLISRLRQKNSRQANQVRQGRKSTVNFQPLRDFSAVKVLDRTAIILDIFAQQIGRAHV